MAVLEGKNLLSVLGASKISLGPIQFHVLQKRHLMQACMYLTYTHEVSE